MNSPRWTHVQGGIHRYDREGYGNVTVFVLHAAGLSGTYGQRVEVDTKRLAETPGLYQRILDRMVRDIEARV